MTPAEQVEAMRQICEAMIGVVKSAGPEGVPAGTLYASLMGKMGLDHFNLFMAALCKSGRIRKSGLLYFAN